MQRADKGWENDGIFDLVLLGIQLGLTWPQRTRARGVGQPIDDPSKETSDPHAAG